MGDREAHRCGPSQIVTALAHACDGIRRETISREPQRAGLAGSLPVTPHRHCSHDGSKVMTWSFDASECRSSSRESWSRGSKSIPCYSLLMDAKQLLAEALRLSDEERAALAGELIQSLDREVDPDAEAAWSEEIRARLDRVDAGTATTISWSEARRRIHAAAGRDPGA